MILDYFSVNLETLADPGEWNGKILIIEHDEEKQTVKVTIEKPNSNLYSATFELYKEANDRLETEYRFLHYTDEDEEYEWMSENENRS